MLERGLRRNGYVVDAVGDGEQALRYLIGCEYEVAVVDWRMPVISGVEVVRRLRHRGSSIPVLLLTARDTTADRVEGLDAGADDYLVKPFEFAELLARLRALQRRPATNLQPRLEIGGLLFDPASRRVLVAEVELALTRRERAILELLMRRYPAVVGRRTIAVQAWDDESGAVGSNTIDVHLARLRAKLVGTSVRISTVRGVGYRLEVTEGVASG